MALSIPSHVAQTVYTKINALKASLTMLPAGPERDAAVALEADLHKCLADGFKAAGGVFIDADDYAAQATTNAPSVVLLSGGGPKD